MIQIKVKYVVTLLLLSQCVLPILVISKLNTFVYASVIRTYHHWMPMHLAMKCGATDENTVRNTSKIMVMLYCETVIFTVVVIMLVH